MPLSSSRLWVDGGGDEEALHCLNLQASRFLVAVREMALAGDRCRTAARSRY